MSKLQEHLEILQDTVVDLRDAINEQGVECSPCTPFRQYPDLVRSINGSGVRSSSVVTVFAYKISNDGHPGIPKGGSFNFDTNEYEVATSWVKSDNLSASDRDTVWMTQAMFASNSNNAGNLVDGWSAPIKLASLTQATTDYKHEIYQRTATNQRPDQPVSNGFTTPYGWSSAKLGLDAAEPYIWVSEKTDETGSWSIPVLYAYLAKDGVQGPQGIPGQDGEDGKTSRITFAFKLWNSNINGPETPYGGSWNLSTNDITLPDSWDHNPPNKTDDMRFVWLSMAEFVSTKPNNPTWSKPTCITGEDGVEGTDGLNSEFVYAILKSTDHFEVFKTYLESEKYSLEISDTDTVPHFIHNGEDTGSNILNVQTEGYDFNVTITDSPEGIDNVNKVEIYWTRTKSSEGTWNPWIGPMYWSVWGENGMDGDGIEYIFSVSSDSTWDYPIPTYAELLAREDQTEALRFQEREYCPEGWFDNDENGEFTGVGPDAPWLFCAMRKQYFNEEENKQMWGDFSEPKIWGHWGRDGMGAYTSFMFYISKEDLSNYVVTGGTYEKPTEGLKTQKPGEDGTLEDVQIQWTDSLSKTPAFDETIWMINKFFNNSPTEAEDKWFGPMKMADSEHFQVEFNCPMMEDETSEYDPFKTPDKPYYLPSLQTFKEESAQSGIIFNTNDELEAAWRDYVKKEGYGTWTDGGKNAVYMATARFVNNKWEDWSVNKIRGEKGDAGNSTQFIFKLGSYSPLDNPTPDLTNEDLAKAYQNADYKPEDWEYAPQSIKKDTPVCWMSKRDCKNGIWEAYSDPSIWAMYAEGNRTFELSEDEINIPCEPSGYIDESYADFITVTFSLYDSGTLVDVKDCYYSALINDDKDHLITSNDSNLNKEDPATCGFDGRILYIGKEFLNNHYQLEGNLRVECQVKYSAIGDPEQDGVSYTKILWIKKSTNAYELNITPNVIHISSDGKCKNDQINIHPIKYIDGVWKQVDTGHIDYILTTSNEDNPTIPDSVNITDLGAQIPLTTVSNLLNVSIKCIQTINNEDVEVSSEVIGVTRDANDAVSKYLAQIFCRTNAQIGNDEYVPKGGTYLNPNDLDEDSPQIPVMGADGQPVGTTQWTDGVPTYDKDNPMLLWMSYRWFYSDDNMNEGEEWSVPILMQDTSTIDIWWCDDNVSDPGNPDSHPDNVVWYDGDISNLGSEGGSNNQTHNPYWMAIRYTIDGVQTGWRVSKIQAEDGKDGNDGKDAVAQFKSYAFAWLTNEEAANNEPTGGSYDDPVPNAPWEDGVPTKPSDDTKRLYCSYAWFTSDGSGDSKWSKPQVMADSADFDVEFSSKLTPGSPSGHPNTNTDWTQDSTNAIWMATSKLSEGIWSPWKVVKIKGEDGKDGQSFNMKGTQPTTDDLPKNGNTIGDAYIVDKHVWVWDGYDWKDCGDLQGPQGEPGEPGESQYIHIKYATKDSNGDYMFTKHDGEDPGDYVGICVDNNPDDPDDVDAYKWSYAKGSDGWGYEFIYKRTDTNNGGSAPNSIQIDGHEPFGWTGNPVGVDPTYKWEWVSHRVKRDNKWGDWSTPALWSYYGDVHDYYVYIYQKGDGKPSKPAFGNKIYDSDLNLGNWADYPTLDGTSQWWQCILTVQGGTNKIVNVSEVVPVNGQPGADGSYTEFRFRWTNSSDDVPSRPTSAQPTDWSVTTPSKGEGDNILWMIHAEKTSTGEFKNNGWSNPVQISGEQGAGVSEIKEFYLLTNSDKTPAYTENWQDTPKQPTKDSQYLWNYEATYINSSTEPIHKSTPYLLSKWQDGRGLVKITDYYAISNSNTTKPTGYATSATANGYMQNDTWKTEPPVLTPIEKYLWNFEIIEYNREPYFEVTEPCVIGVYGDTGPQGDKGEQGEKGEQGDKGAKMRYGIWKTGVAYQNGSEGDEFYDIVSYNNNRYLCTKDHTSSSNILPTNIEYWKSANEFEFLATGVLVSDIIGVEDITVGKLSTNGDYRITIEDGQMTASNQNKSSQIKFGVDDDGNLVLQFWKNNNLLYDLGPLGLRNLTGSETHESTAPVKISRLSKYENYDWQTVIRQLQSNIETVETALQDIYYYTKYIRINGTVEYDEHHATYYENIGKTRIFSGYSLGGSEMVFSYAKDGEVPADVLDNIAKLNADYGWNVNIDGDINIYSRVFTVYDNGKITQQIPLYYSKNRTI